MQRTGSILIVVLFVLAALSATALSFAYRVRLTLRATSDEATMTQLTAQAQSALAVALSRLRDNTNDFDHPAEPWCAHEPLASEGWLKAWQAEANGRAAYEADYRVVDEQSKLHVLWASGEDFQELGMTPEQVASLFDWMDKDDVAQAGGAESFYYQGLAKPYRCKNGPLELLDELPLIRGFSLAGYLGEDANRNGMLDAPENDGQASYPPDDADGVLNSGWVSLLTCHGAGLININTASEAVLRTMHISEEAVGQIVGYRQFDRQSGGRIEDHAFRSHEDIEQLQGLSDVDRQTLMERAVFSSTHFRVFVQTRHVRTGLRYGLEVLVRAHGGDVEILQWRAGT